MTTKMDRGAGTGRSMLEQVAVTALVLALAACGGGGEPAAENQGQVTGSIEIDGSSTVYPISEAMAEEFQRENPQARVTVGISGTGGGFKRFCAGETDISNASREIVPDEIEACRQAGIGFTEVRVALDGLSVVTNPSNTFVDCLTVDELRQIWQPGSTMNNWSQIRTGFPDKRLALYGAGTDSGTFDYFTDAINGEEGASRPDYTASEDDNVLVQGVAGDPNALGYFGYAYYEENADQMKLLGIDGGAGCVQPTPETIESGEYAPLSRPLFIYVSDRGLAKPQVQAFVDYHLENAAALVPSVGYVPLEAARYQEEAAKVQRLAAAGSGMEAAPDTAAAIGDTSAAN